MTDKIFPFQSFAPFATNTQVAAFGGQSQTFFCVSNNTMRSFDLGTPVMKAEAIFDAPPQGLTISKNDTAGIAYFDSGKAIIFDPHTLKQTKQISAHRAPVTASALTPNGQFAATGAKDGNVRFWNCSEGQLLQDLNTAHQSQMKNGQMTKLVDINEIVSLQFNYNASWLYIGDASGRILVWDLTKLIYRGEIFLGNTSSSFKSVQYIFSHPIERVIIASDGQKATVFDAQNCGVVSTTPIRNGGYSGLFCPVKDAITVGVRKHGIDIFDYGVVENSGEKFMKNQLEYQFNNIISVCQRTTSTIPQILVMVANPNANVVIYVVSLKYVFPFNKEDNPTNMYKAIDNSEKIEYVPSQPKKSNSNYSSKGSVNIDKFMQNHNDRLGILSDKLLVLNQLKNREERDVLDLVQEFDDCRLVCDILQRMGVLKTLDLNGGTKVLEIINKNLKRLEMNNRPDVYDNVVSCCNIVQEICNSFSQVVKETCTFARQQGGKIDFGTEERLSRCVNFSNQAGDFLATSEMIMNSNIEPKVKMQLKTAVTNVARLGITQI
ncbi:WD40 repeat protein [Spironucleus salmonicida]|uniref:WD40 repeat protein n=1 Tax=Spironucleus salmonicida TaxID=348837 RepID=V6LBI7_9EUKA|nr:WD40 repeat protein [Spironucleus salmonicida]|eukprot:EST41825.1 hypothetical protein SS50377_18659 [Spironucleus salmonicida]